jgi:hypothetical protein
MQIAELGGFDAQKAASQDVAAWLANSEDWVVLPDLQNELSGDADGGEWWKFDVDSWFGKDMELQEKVTGHTVARLEHDVDVDAVAISRRGNWIGTVSARKVFLWTWSQTGLIELTCGLIAGNLTAAEWKEHHLEELGLGPHRLTCPGSPFLSKQ